MTNTNVETTVRERRGPLAVASAVLLTLLASASWAAGAPEAQAAPPEAFTVYDDQYTLGNEESQHSISLPAGAYAISAKLTGESFGTLQTLRCRIFTTGTPNQSDESRQALENRFTQTMALNVTSNFTNGAFLRCVRLSGSGNTELTHIKITAVKVNSVVITGI